MSNNTPFHDTSDRKYNGFTATTLFKSQQEAPEVSHYDYANVQFQGNEGAFTDMDAFQSQWTSTLFGGISNVAMPQVPIETLLEDALVCVRIDDGTRLHEILKNLQEGGNDYPADIEFGEMFRGTLWERVSDPDFKISDAQREVALELLKYFHKSSDEQQ